MVRIFSVRGLNAATEAKLEMPKLSSRSVLGLLAAAAALAAAIAAYAYFVEPQRLVIDRQELPVRGLDARLEGLKIVAIADIHAGSNGADAQKLRRVVEETNQQEADIVVLLGDYISEDRNSPSGFAVPVPLIVEELAGMRAKYGVFAVMGNHDAGAATEQLTRGFQSVGYQVLNGKLAVLNINGAKLRLLGTKDHQQITIWKNFSDENKALLASTEGQGDVIILQHSPDILPIITGNLEISKDLRLMIAGHTHGGQVWFPVIGAPIVPSSYGQKYAAGHIKDALIDIFVTTGVGTNILPFRFMVPPEIAVLTLRRTDAPRP